MRKAFSVFALIAFACDISRDVPVHGDPVGNPEVAGRSDDYEYQKEPRGRFDDAEVPRRSVKDRKRGPSEPVGRWRSNGEALEPKWRDGDYVPLLPFSHYRSYTRDEEIDDAEDFPETSRRPFKYRYSINQPDHPRESPDRRGVPSPDDYDVGATYRSPEDYSREKQRPSKKNPRDNPTLDKQETLESAASNDGKRGRNIVDDSINDREVVSRYREAFQARPDEYEHEFNDEEYMKPRPRKRRPPQNYEFALANEASSNEENEESRDSSRLPSSSNGDENLPVMTRSNADNERENALELKSLLKMQQEEGSSLSEILQRRNLSLSDLLKGKADVINALKSRIADESDEYIEEMSRAMSDSLMKLAATVTPPWRSMTTEGTAVKITVSNTSDNSIYRMTIVPHEVSENYDEVSSNDTNRVKEESKDAENIATQFARDSSWRRMASTTPPIVSTVITTSTTSPPIAVNSMEYFLNDDGNAGSTSDRVAKFENLDEDEIMEFSDFTDFKKGKSSVKASSERMIATSQQPPRDIESTLSIEQILNPTERIVESTRYRESDNADGNTESNSNTRIIQDNGQSIPIGEPASAEDYNTFIEAEYQNDAPIPEEDHEKRNKVRSNPSANQTDAVASPIEKKQIANPVDDIKKLYDKNHSTEYHQVTRSPVEKIRDRASLENHQSAGSRQRYEEVVSEIEPEARAEIFELFASGSAGKRLERLLKSRNMSVEELIALRQRGSSKVHLTEVSQLRVTKPQNNLQTLETSNTNNEELIIQLSPTDNSNERVSEGKKASEKEGAKREKTEESMARFIKQDIMSYLHDPFFGKDVENMSMSRLLDLVERDKNASRGTTFPENDTLDEHSGLQNTRRTMQLVDLLTTFDSLPFVKDVQRQFDTVEIDNNGFVPKEPKLPVDNDNASVVLVDEETKIVGADNKANSSGQFHAGYVEEVVREEPNVIDIRTIYGERMSDGEERKTLSQMKPSIIASGAILGVTIVVFLAIFIVCRIRQKQKYTYRNTFSRAVFQNPVMMARKLSNSSSLSTVMVNVVATSTTKRPERTEMQETAEEFDGKNDMDNDSLDGNDSWETIPDYAK